MSGAREAVGAQAVAAETAGAAATLSGSRLGWSVDGHPIVDGVTVAAVPGRVLGLLGPNGAGKTTLLRMLAGVLAPTAGVVTLDGRELRARPRREVARLLALVEQEADTEDDLTVEDVIDLGRIPHLGRWAGPSADDRRIVAHAARRTGVDHLLERRWHTLSGGERQRVHLARAFAQGGRTLLLDEPTNHLDVSRQLGLLATVRGTGLAVIVALHDLNLALAYCDEVVVMAGGRAVAAGPPRETLTADLVRRVYRVEARVRRFDDGAPPMIQFLGPADDPGTG